MTDARGLVEEVRALSREVAWMQVRSIAVQAKTSVLLAALSVSQAKQSSLSPIPSALGFANPVRPGASQGRLGNGEAAE